MHPVDNAMVRMIVNFIVPGSMAIIYKTNLSVPSKFYGVLSLRIILGFIAFAALIWVY